MKKKWEERILKMENWTKKRKITWNRWEQKRPYLIEKKENAMHDDTISWKGEKELLGIYVRWKNIFCKQTKYKAEWKKWQ